MWFYYICWGLKTIYVVAFRNNECFPPTSAALFLSTLGGKKGAKRSFICEGTARFEEKVKAPLLSPENLKYPIAYSV